MVARCEGPAEGLAGGGTVGKEVIIGVSLVRGGAPTAVLVGGWRDCASALMCRVSGGRGEGPCVVEHGLLHRGAAEPTNTHHRR